MYPLPKPLVPKDPQRGLMVVVIGRISTVHQKLESIEAGYRVVREFLDSCYQDTIDAVFLGEQASGMLADRDTIVEAERLIATGNVDLVIAEDLGRIYRNPRLQYAFVQDVVDQDTRLICIADHIDTADENWETTLATATLMHGLVVPQTRRRVTSRGKEYFDRGGMVTKVRYGFRKLTDEEARSGQFGPVGLKLAKEPAATPTIREMMRRVLDHEPYERIAEWLRAEAIPTGPYAASDGWTGKLLIDFLRDPILQGMRTFRRTTNRRLFKTGRAKRCRNPDGPITRYYPSLAHLTAEEHSQLLEEMERRASAHRFATGRTHPRFNVARTKSIWPRQHARCAICGGLMYHYDRDQIKCQRAREHGQRHCWCHVQVNCELARRRVLEWLVHYLSGRDDWRELLVDSAWGEIERQSRRSVHGLGSVDAEISRLRRESARLSEAIAKGGQFDALLDRLRAADVALQRAQSQRAEIESAVQQSELPTTRQALRDNLAPSLLELARSSYEFADLMRQVFPTFEIQPVQALDTPLVRPRARLTFSPSALLPSKQNEVTTATDVEVVLDLFDPPMHIRYLAACVALRRQHPDWTLIQIADALRLGPMTVKRALKYATLMSAAGAVDPYQPLGERPACASRWK